GCDVAQALADQCLSEDGRGGGSVTGDVVGLLGDLLDELRTDLLVRVVELDLLGDRHTVVRDRGGAPLLLEDDVAATRAEGHLDCVGQDVQAALEATTGLLIESDDFCHESFVPPGRRRWVLALRVIECQYQSGTRPMRVQAVRRGRSPSADQPAGVSCASSGEGLTAPRWSRLMTTVSCGSSLSFMDA